MELRKLRRKMEPREKNALILGLICVILSVLRRANDRIDIPEAKDILGFLIIMVFSFFIEFFLRIFDNKIRCKSRKVLFSVMMTYALCAIIYTAYIHEPRPPLDDRDRYLFYFAGIFLFFVYYFAKTITISSKKKLDQINLL